MESSENSASFLSEILKGSKMIRIYQKEKSENEKANKVINDLVEKYKNWKCNDKSNTNNGVLTGLMIAGFIFFW